MSDLLIFDQFVSFSCVLASVIFLTFSKMTVADKLLSRIDQYKKHPNSNLVVHIFVQFRLILIKIAKVIRGWNGVMFRAPPCICTCMYFGRGYGQGS